jgi:hypothetical protein
MTSTRSWIGFHGATGGDSSPQYGGGEYQLNYQRLRGAVGLTRHLSKQEGFSWTPVDDCPPKEEQAAKILASAPKKRWSGPLPIW